MLRFCTHRNIDKKGSKYTPALITNTFYASKYILIVIYILLLNLIRLNCKSIFNGKLLILKTFVVYNLIFKSYFFKSVNLDCL